MDPIAAHQHSRQHRTSLLQSTQCGCFHCLAIFPVQDIKDWCDEVDGIGQTALCPNCSTDSLICDGDLPITIAFLEAMRGEWFGG